MNAATPRLRGVTHTTTNVMAQFTRSMKPRVPTMVSTPVNS